MMEMDFGSRRRCPAPPPRLDSTRLDSYIRFGDFFATILVRVGRREINNTVSRKYVDRFVGSEVVVDAFLLL